MRGCTWLEQFAKSEGKFAKRKSIDAKGRSKSPDPKASLPKEKAWMQNPKASLQKFFSDGKSARAAEKQKSQDSSGEWFVT
jgi:hypothetical protein